MNKLVTVIRTMRIYGIGSEEAYWLLFHADTTIENKLSTGQVIKPGQIL